MQLPRSVKNRVQYILERTQDLRNGSLQADPRWLTCIDQTLAESSDEKRLFFEQFFVQGLSCDDVQFNLYIERSTMYAWRNHFLWNVALKACACGLIKVCE